MDREILATFNNNEQSFLTNNNEKFYFKETLGPYEYLLGALSGCFFRTLEDYTPEIKYDEIQIKVGGNKRKTSPTMLELTKLVIIAKGIIDKTEFEKAIKWTQENCSIYNTIAAVSKMELEIQYL